MGFSVSIFRTSTARKNYLAIRDITATGDNLIFFWSKMPTAPTMVLFRAAIPLRNQVMFPTFIPQRKKQDTCFGMHSLCHQTERISIRSMMKPQNLLCCFTKKVQTANKHLGSSISKKEY